MQTPFFSICIPAYNRTDGLERLLESILIQTCKDFEIVICDDSTEDAVEISVQKYLALLPIRYFRNNPAFGNAENWNSAIRHAEGEWIKLMHDDDWFAAPDCLEIFYQHMQQNPEATFLFTAYQNVDFSRDLKKEIRPARFWRRALAKDACILFSRNIIGPPSVTMYKRNETILYDPQFKWLVDIDFYIRYLNAGRAFYIPVPLICIGISDAQITKMAFGNKQVEIPESMLLFQKTGFLKLNNLIIFDGWWRLVRNLQIRSVESFRSFAPVQEIPLRIERIIKWQCKIHGKLLRIGPASKMFMFFCYLTQPAGI